MAFHILAVAATFGISSEDRIKDCMRASPCWYPMIIGGGCFAGDSRAVLYRRGEPVPLSTEHKVEIPQEKVSRFVADIIVNCSDALLSPETPT